MVGFSKKLCAVIRKFGWVLSGSITCSDGSSDSSIGRFVCSVRGRDTLSEKVESFWVFESLRIVVRSISYELRNVREVQWRTVR